MAKAQKYSIAAGFAGKVVWTKPPPFKRTADCPGRFELNDDLSQKEMAYLHEVMQVKDAIRVTAVQEPEVQE